MADKTIYKRHEDGKKLAQQDPGAVRNLRFKERNIALEKTISIGRGKINTIVISDDKLVSRLHAIIEKNGPDYYIMDKGSMNGTYVNNNPLKKDARHQLQPGDVVTVGKTKLLIQ